MDQEENQPDISKEDTLDPHCLNCNMPMTKSEDFGTNEDGSQNDEYCCHCMQGGNLF